LLIHLASVKFSRVAHICFWTATLIAFICISGPRISRLAVKNSIHFVGAFHSTDSFFFFDTGSPNASERLIGRFESIPRSESVVIFTHSDDRRSSFIGMMVAYLAWPHPVQIIDIVDRNYAPSGATSKAIPGAYVFCRVEPPASLPPAEHFGTTIQLITGKRVAAK
jgi:hypothetical protein